MTTESTDAKVFGNQRRKALKAIGGAAFVVSAAGLGACSGGDSEPSQRGTGNNAQSGASEAMDAIEDGANDIMETAEDTIQDLEGTADETMPSAQNAANGGPNLPRLDESDPQAQALSYVDDAMSVDAAAQPRYAAGQNCLNCSLYTGRDSDEWGPCSIFPGKAVSAAGWCSVYAPKA